MASDDICSTGQACRRHAMRGSESVGIVQRLEELMRMCREDGHQLTYQDLARVRYSGPEEQPHQVRHHPV